VEKMKKDPIYIAAKKARVGKVSDYEKSLTRSSQITEEDLNTRINALPDE
jgi:hypothetical protein